jgi:hypothetical protein
MNRVRNRMAPKIRLSGPISHDIVIENDGSRMVARIRDSHSPFLGLPINLGVLRPSLSWGQLSFMTWA